MRDIQARPIWVDGRKGYALYLGSDPLAHYLGRVEKIRDHYHYSSATGGWSMTYNVNIRRLFYALANKLGRNIFTPLRASAFEPNKTKG